MLNRRFLHFGCAFGRNDGFLVGVGMDQISHSTSFMRASFSSYATTMMKREWLT